MIYGNVISGQVTTPQLHYVVAAHNCPTYGPTDDFIKRFADGVQLFMSVCACC